MKHYNWVLFLIIQTMTMLFLSSCGTSSPTSVPTSMPTSTPLPGVPFSKENVVEIPSISAIVGQGELSLTQGKKPGDVRVEIKEANIPIVNGKECDFCVEIIKFGPDLKVAVDRLFQESEPQESGFVQDSIVLKNVSLEGPKASDSSTIFILSGPNGATLKKQGKGFLLVEGDAYLIRP
jgi:hypothetical protein